MTNPLYDALFASLRGQDRPLIILPDGGTIAASEFHAMIARSANALHAMGLEPGDRVAVQATKSPEMLALYAAALSAGIVFLPLNTAYTPEELAYFIKDCTPSLLLVDHDRAPRLQELAAALGTRLETLASNGSFDRIAADQADVFTAARRGPDDLAALLYTSGTTGRSKGAMLSHDNLLSNARALAEAWRFTSADVLLHALPIFHAHGLFVASNTVFLTSGSMIFQPRFDVDDVIAALPKATTMMGVPTFYTRLLHDPRLTRDLVAHMRLFISGSAPLLAETHQQWSARTGHAILERYGMTETTMITSNPYDGERRPGTVGRPLRDIQIRIADQQTAAALPQGDIGMIEVKGPNVFKGYWQMPEKTAEEFRADGYFITGDLGRLDSDGYLQIVGREKDLVISGGYNVYPKEVESVLDDMPGVLESAVIGVPHPDFGEAVLAILVPDADGPDIQRIKDALAEKLARYKQPKSFILMPELPRNTMGKVQKAALRQQFATHFALTGASSGTHTTA